MANLNAVGQRTELYFSSVALAEVVAQPINATGNAVVALPILSGGVSTGQSYIIRRITVSSPSNTAGGTVPSLATANVTVLTTSDGNTSNAVTTAAGQTLGSITTGSNFQDLTLVTAAATTAYTASALFLKVGVAVANAAVNVTVWGDVVG